MLGEEKEMKADLHRGLTLLLLYVNILIDSGKHESMTLEIVREKIRAGSLLRFLREVSGETGFDHFLDGSPYGNFEQYYETSMQAIEGAYAGDELRRWGVENQGLCLVMGWTIEILKLGSGWIPGDLAGVIPA